MEEDSEKPMTAFSQTEEVNKPNVNDHSETGINLGTGENTVSFVLKDTDREGNGQALSFGNKSAVGLVDEFDSPDETVPSLDQDVMGSVKIHLQDPIEGSILDCAETKTVDLVFAERKNSLAPYEVVGNSSNGEKLVDDVFIDFSCSSIQRKESSEVDRFTKGAGLISDEPNNTENETFKTFENSVRNKKIENELSTDASDANKLEMEIDEESSPKDSTPDECPDINILGNSDTTENNNKEEAEEPNFTEKGMITADISGPGAKENSVSTVHQKEKDLKAEKIKENNEIQESISTTLESESPLQIDKNSSVPSLCELAQNVLNKTHIQNPQKNKNRKLIRLQQYQTNLRMIKQEKSVQDISWKSDQITFPSDLQRILFPAIKEIKMFYDVNVKPSTSVLATGIRTLKSEPVSSRQVAKKPRLRLRKTCSCQVSIKRRAAIDELLPAKKKPEEVELEICESCHPKRIFVSKTAFDHHVQRKHSKVISSVGNFEFKNEMKSCRSCRTTFRSEKKFSAHLKKCGKEKSSTTNNKSVAVNPVKKSEEKRPGKKNVCKVCNKRFLMATGLKSHMKKHELAASNLELDPSQITDISESP